MNFCENCGGNDENPVGHCTDCPIVHDLLWELHLYLRRGRPSISKAKALSAEISNLVNPDPKK